MERGGVVIFDPEAYIQHLIRTALRDSPFKLLGDPAGSTDLARGIIDKDKHRDIAVAIVSDSLTADGTAKLDRKAQAARQLVEHIRKSRRDIRILGIYHPDFGALLHRNVRVTLDVSRDAVINSRGTIISQVIKEQL